MDIGQTNEEQESISGTFRVNFALSFLVANHWEQCFLRGVQSLMGTVLDIMLH